MNLIIISIFYLIFGLGISFTISYFYLRHYPKKESNVKFAFYSSVFVFGYVIFFIFLIPFDIASSCIQFKEGGSNFILDSLPMYYLIIGYFSQTVGEVFCPMMILYHSTGFYKKWDIAKDVLKRYFNDYFSVIKLIFITVVSIPTIKYAINDELDLFDLFKTFLLYLNFFPYLEILYYIGFVCQDLVYSYLRRELLHRDYYNFWKLGKIYKYYNREKVNVNVKYEKIKKEFEDAVNKYNLKPPKEFLEHFNKFEDNVIKTQKNLLFIISDQEKVQFATNKYKDEKLNEMKEEINNLTKNEETKKLYDEKNDFNEMFKDAEKSEEELRKELGSDYEYIMGGNKNDNKNENVPLIPINHSKFDKWETFEKYICELMTDVIESSLSVERKSFLINTKGVELYIGKYKKPNPIIFLPIIIFYIILFFLEMPWSIYEWFPLAIKNFYGNLFIPFSSIIFYFFIFNYAIIQHRYISGNLIFGTNMSGSINFYNFISFVLNYCDAMFYHSIWVLKKNKLSESIKKDENIDIDNVVNKYLNNFFEPKYFDVFELPEIYIKNINIVPLISMFVIIISIFNAAKFSNFKIRRKEVILFNENADFFYNENNLYSNFILGCGVLFSVEKNIDLIRSLGY